MAQHPPTTQVLVYLGFSSFHQPIYHPDEVGRNGKSSQVCLVYPVPGHPSPDNDQSWHSGGQHTTGTLEC